MSQPGGPGREPSSSPETSRARTRPRRAASSCAPPHRPDDDGLRAPPPTRGTSSHYTDANGRRIYDAPTNGFVSGRYTQYFADSFPDRHQSPSGSSDTEVYNPCDRDADYRSSSEERESPESDQEFVSDDEDEPPATYVEDVTDDEDEPRPTYSESSADDREDDDSVPPEGAQHYRYTGEDRPIVTFPASPEHLCILGADTRTVPEYARTCDDYGVPGNLAPTPSKPATTTQYDDPPQDIEMRDATPTTSDSSSRPHHPTGKAMEWESESSDDEESTDQRFRRKEPSLTLVPYQPLPKHAPVAAAPNRVTEEVDPNPVLEAATPPAATPRSSPLSAAMSMSSGTIGQLLDQMPAEA
ncbi:germ cell nuclear acidic protein-like [Drosophila kikkawai]|uniref:Germ cell nuclear acidic protein-like n=1 Tax=Drosophila kikkawai TaxID=30033 RepID=A0ABM4GFW2_DROKI